MTILIGQVFGRLTVLNKADPHIGSNGKRRTKWVCRCECGNLSTPFQYNLSSGKSQSCGCAVVEVAAERLTKHGGKRTRLYRTWMNMRFRCLNENSRSFKNYGGRGIRFYDGWSDFAEFRSWALRNGYRDDLTIEREDNDGDYHPDNCRWATVKEQARNKRSNRPVRRDDGKVYGTVKEAADASGLDPSTIRYALTSSDRTAGGYHWQDWKREQAA